MGKYWISPNFIKIGQGLQKLTLKIQIWGLLDDYNMEQSAEQN